MLLELAPATFYRFAEDEGIPVHAVTELAIRRRAVAVMCGNWSPEPGRLVEVQRDDEWPEVFQTDADAALWVVSVLRDAALHVVEGDHFLRIGDLEAAGVLTAEEAATIRGGE